MRKLKEDWLKSSDPGATHDVYWAEYGLPEGRPLLLVHGGFGHIFNMNAFNGVTDRRVLALHQRGVGNSLPSGETAANTINENIKDIERLRSHLGIDRWDMLSWSFGAVLMAGYAFQNPQKCNKLIAYAPYLGSEEDYRCIIDNNSEAAKNYLEFHNAKTVRDIVRSVFNKAAHGDYEEQILAYSVAMKIWDPSLMDETIRSSRTESEWIKLFKDRLIGAQLDLELFNEKKRFLSHLSAQQALRRPVTLIYGSEDKWSAPHTYTDLVFPEKKVVIVPGAGHDIHDHKAQASIRAVLNQPQQP